MKEYKAPMLSSWNNDTGFAAPALLVAGLAKGLAAGVAAGAAAFGAKKAFGNIVEMNIPALEPCVN